MLLPAKSYSQIDNYVFSTAPHLYCGDVTVSGAMCSQFPFFPLQNDTLRALVVFVNYPDGDYETPNGSVLQQFWPASSYLQKPTWADSVICPTTTNVWHPSLTGLFRDMSGGKFWLIGDVYPDLVVLDNEISYYAYPTRNLGYVTKEVLEKIDEHVDWSLYDRLDPCDYNQNSNKNEPDGVVDFIFIVFRFANAHIVDGQSYTGIACLGGLSRSFAGQPDYTTKSGHKIDARFPGSGSIQEMTDRWSIGVMTHEFIEHYTYGSGHSGVMGQYNMNGGNFASAVDREKYNWNFGNNYTPTSNTTITLRDYVTTGDFIKIQRTSDAIYIENRRRYSYYATENYRSWKWGADDPRYPLQSDSGLVIYRRTGTRIFEIQSANGKWNWQQCFVSPYQRHKITYYTPSHNIWHHDTPDRLGGLSTFYLNKRVMDISCNPIPNQFNPNPFATIDSITYRGIGGDSNTCFDVGYNQIYSPWSNPALPVTNQNDSLLIEIVDSGARPGEVVVNIYFNNLLDAPPSKPTGVRGEYHIDTTLPDVVYTAVSWVHNIEPDMLRAGDLKRYKVYRGISPNMNEPTSYSCLTMVDIHKDSTPYYVDTILAAGSHVGGTPPPIHYLVGYKIMAVDNTDQESILSDRGKVTAVSPNSCSLCGEQDNISTGKDNVIMAMNYPNPFNPSTMIKFNLPHDGFVSLKVYDMIGREVAVLVNEFRQRGTHEIIFDTHNYTLSSGVYFYTFKVNRQTKIERLVLLK